MKTNLKSVVVMCDGCIAFIGIIATKTPNACKGCNSKHIVQKINAHTNMQFYVWNRRLTWNAHPSYRSLGGGKVALIPPSSTNQC